VAEVHQRLVIFCCEQKIAIREIKCKWQT
jgi:hypothetical protein